eukprot:24604-Prymnesium_polylepis.1
MAAEELAQATRRWRWWSSATVSKTRLDAKIKVSVVIAAGPSQPDRALCAKAELGRSRISTT